MNDTKKIVRILLVINMLQLAVAVLAWISIADTWLETSNHFAFLAMGCVLCTSLIQLAGLYMAWKTNDDRLQESIHNMEALNTTLRAQRHDYINHFQVVYGLMELGEYEEARKYLEPVFKELRKTDRALKTAQPAVNALLHAKLNAAEQKGITVYLEVYTDLKKLPIEAWSLCKVLANIIDNAVHALEKTEEPQLKITIKEGENYSFTIENNGPMIPEEMQEEIFKQGVSTKQEAGHGMGLYIVNKIVKEAGGEIRLTSDAAHTVFCVEIPMQEQSCI
ncbi:MAG: sensor histidine kinase [Lachnospiraceae bacterium]